MEPFVEQPQKEYTYRAGYGISTPPPPNWTASLRARSRGVGMAMTVYFLLSFFLYDWIKYVLLALSYIGLPLRLLESPALTEQTVRIIMALVALPVPFLFYSLSVMDLSLKKALSLRRPKAHITLAAVLIVLGANALGNAAAYILGADAGASNTAASAFGVLPGMPSALFIARTAVIIPIIEEIVFRGIIMRSLSKFGDEFALLASSLLFAFTHGEPARIIPAFLAGLALGCFTLKSGSLRPALTAHILNNALTLLVGFTGSAAGVSGEMITLGMAIFSLLLGILALLLIMHLRPDMFVFESRTETNVSLSAKISTFFTTPPMASALILAAAALVPAFSNFEI